MKNRPTEEEVKQLEHDVLNSYGRGWLYMERFRRLARAYLEVLEDRERIMSEKCALDEVHCTCVPTLRVEIERLRAVVEASLHNHITRRRRGERKTLSDK